MPDTDRPQILALDRVNVSYGKAHVVRDVSFALNPGETFGLIGLNGAGKTSLIKCILGLRTQASGSISVFGEPPAMKKGRMSLSYLPERFEPPWFLTGMEFIKFSLSLYGRPFNPEEVVEKARRLALDPDALRRRVQTYSKGMRQKLGLIGTIMVGCNLMILDEPMSGLDPQARALVKDVLMECRKEGRTIFLTSHILVDMDEICDHVAVLHQGGIVFEGTPGQMKKETGIDNLERAFLQSIEKRAAA
ncbi:MAG: ABC transporter ATP-binding protein [Alphaproteobacteria bacterium]